MSDALTTLARAALDGVAPDGTIGDVLGVDEVEDGVTDVRFASALPGYLGWAWTVSIARLPDLEPSVLEVELLPGEGALVAPPWKPWSDRLAEWRAAHPDEDPDAGSDEDDDEDDPEDDDDLDELVDEIDGVDPEDLEDEDDSADDDDADDETGLSEDELAGDVSDDDEDTDPDDPALDEHGLDEHGLDEHGFDEHDEPLSDAR